MRDRPAVYVAVSGPPASGKSTVAAIVAEALDLPLIAKDVIKEALISVLPVTDVDSSRQLGRAAVAVMFAMAESSPTGAVIDCNFHRTAATDDLRRLDEPSDRRLVEVFCRCDRAVALARYRERAGSRPFGHLDHQRADDEIWNDEVAEPVAGGWPVVEIDTSAPADLEPLVRQLADMLR